MDYIDDHRDSSVPTADDSKQCLAKVDFESALPDRMMKAIMGCCAHKSLNQDIIDAIKLYCRDTGNYESMKVIGDKKVPHLVTSGKYKGKTLIEHGWFRSFLINRGEWTGKSLLNDERVRRSSSMDQQELSEAC